MVKKIAQKKIGSATYELRHFIGDNKYVIYKRDEGMVGDDFGIIPEEAVFSDEKLALEYLEKLS